MPYTHFTLAERKVLYFMQWQEYSQADVARALGRAPSSISRELRRNTKHGQTYCACNADVRYRAVRRNLAVRTKTGNPTLMQNVNTMLKEGWAPEQIAGRLRRVDHPRSPSKWISFQTIYRHVWADKANGGSLFRYLRRGGKRYLKRCGSTRGQIVGRVSIEERPVLVDERRRVGDWEGDTVVGRHHQGLVATFVERKTGYFVAQKMHDKRASTLNRAAKAAFKRVPHQLVQTFTFDNGKEFASFKDLEKHFDARAYFAHPYCAWERATNENTNGLLRQFLPKKTDLRSLTQAQLDIIAHRLNNRPRKRLDYRTPCEAFQKAIVALRV